ncbi:MAG: glutamate--tRNA ligase [Candidatus Nomurabacteria bacterium]|jgi:glutamyl-tRNA synthetase|nr:glutamate--tRNA ligase [Candidatus Nomurabacteria bacterium]
MKKAVTRFAPSPTGYIHIGNVRSAIYPYLVARQTDGDFILRIEDTDQARFVEGATELIMDTLKWLGLDWNEGPGVGGPHAPYFQTERAEIYKEWAEKLIAAGRAYADSTPSETINKYREEANRAKKPFLYRDYRPENTPKWEAGIPLRFKAEPKDYDYHDEVYGDLHMGPETQDDFILIKADGLPTYNFAHIVDDATMGVTHVMRGQEYLPSMGNYLALYDALELERPIFAQLPHILGPTGNKKLGKRDGAKSVTDYRDDGILGEAMVNFLACLGWNDGTEKELYSMEDLVREFKLNRVQRAGARFDENKLNWLNGQWIRRLFTEDAQALYARTEGFWPESASGFKDAEKYAVFEIIYDRLKTLSDLQTMTDYFFVAPRIDQDMIFENKFLKKFSEQELMEMLRKSVDKLDQVSEWNAEVLQGELNRILAESGKKPAEIFSLIRISLSFAPFSPALHDTMKVLGKNVTLARLNAVITALANN